MMKKKGMRILLAGLVSAFMITAFAGCGGNDDSDLDYGDQEFTVDFLTGDYAQQLTTDGAETVVGNVTITGEEGNYTVQVKQKEVVVNENYDGGYYIADRNMTSEYAFGSDVGLVIMKDGEPTLCDVPEFIESVQDDDTSLYTVYVMGDTVELILPLDPETMVSEN